MRSFLPTLLLAITTVTSAQSIVYPNTKTVDISDTYFGQTIVDPYRWLEYDTSHDVEEWQNEQNQFSEKYLRKNAARFKTTTGVYQFGNYSTRTLNNENDRLFVINEGGLGPGLYFKKKGDVQLVIRPLKYGRHKDISFFVASKDKKLVAVGLSDAGSDWDEVRIKNLETEKNYTEVVKGIKFGRVAWQGAGFFYCRYSMPTEAQLLSAKNVELGVFYHKLGEDQRNDKLIYTENNPSNIIHVETTDDERFLIIYGNDIRNQQPYSKLMYIDFSDPSFVKPRIFLMMPKANIEVVDNIADSLFIISDYKAPKKRIFTCNPKRPNKINLVVAENDEPLSQVTIIDNKLICLYKENANYFSMVYDFSGKALHKMSFPLGSDVVGFQGTKDQIKTRYRCNTFTYPPITYEYDLRTFATKSVSVSAKINDYTKFNTVQDFYTSKDGTKIPIYIVYKKNLKTNGSNPCLLYGYGGFGISMTPFFEAGLMHFLDRGGVLAAPCIRGGGEYGEQWHKGGSLLNKQNSFDDFIAAAEYMISKNFTNSSKLAMMGASNGASWLEQ